MTQRGFDISIDLHAIGIFRIGLALILILDLVLNKMPFAEIFYSDAGIFDHNTLELLVQSNANNQLYGFGLLNFIDSAGGVKLFFAVTLLFYFLLLAGVFSRLFAVLSFVMLWSIHHANPYVLSGPDDLLINLLFIGLFLPLDQRFSIVRVGPERTKGFAGLTSFYALFFIGLMYFFQAFLKEGDLWKSGQAISYAAMETLWVKPFALALVSKTELCFFLSKATIWLEYSIPVLIFSPYRNSRTRIAAVFLILFFHSSIFLFFDVGLLPLLALVYAILLVPTEVWNFLLQKIKFDNLPIKARQVNRFIFSDRKFVKQFIKVAISAILILIVWGSFLVSVNGQKMLPNPEFMKTLQKTTLFRQNWGFYAPDPSTFHGWCKVAGVTREGNLIDMRTLNTFQFGSADLEYYSDYSWKIFVYKTCIYYDPIQQEILDRWADYEFKKSQEIETHDIVQIRLVRFSSIILAPDRSTPIAETIVAYSPRD